jgi:hypothetical protein
MASIKCARCCYPDAIISYVIRTEGHCVCPQCDHIWVHVSVDGDNLQAKPRGGDGLKQFD